MKKSKKIKLLTDENLSKVTGGLRVSQDFKNAFFGPVYEHYRGTSIRFKHADFGSLYSGASAALLTLGTSWIVGGIYGKVKGRKPREED